jgi:hypothetical protein
MLPTELLRSVRLPPECRWVGDRSMIVPLR